MIGCGLLELIGSYSSLGWFFGSFTSPAAATALGLLGGFNFAFWIVRHALHLHLPASELSADNISMVSATWPAIGELSFTMGQLLVLFGTMAFGSPISLHHAYLMLVFSGGLSLIANLRAVLAFIAIPPGVYWMHMSRILSQLSLLMLFFTFYYIQISHKMSPDLCEDGGSQRIGEMQLGYHEFLSAFKVKNYQML